ncbi:CBS domain-containing protein [Chloroflexota bacterium]
MVATRTRVIDIMKVRTARINQGSNIHHAAEIVALSGVSDLMVVDDDDQFIGVLSEGDILRTALPDIDEILDEGGTLDDAFQIFLERGKQLATLPIAPLIIREPIVLDPENHIAQAATILVEKQIRLLPVVKEGKLVGTISRADVCRAVVGTL